MNRPTQTLLTVLLTLLPLAAVAETVPAEGSEPAATASDVPSQAARATAAANGVTAASAALQMGAKGHGGRNITAFDRPGQRGIGGYFAQEFTASSDGRVYFDARQMVLTASSYLHDNLFFNTEIEYNHGGDVGRGGEIKIEQAWGEYSINEALNLRAGILLIPVGRLNVYHDADFRETTARPLATRAIIPTTWYEPGVGARGAFSPNDTMEVSYEAYVTQGLTQEISAASGLSSARPQQGRDNNIGKAVTGRVAFSPWLGTEVGLSGYATPYDDASNKWMGLGALDMQWRQGPFEIVAEGSLVNTSGGTFTSNNATVTTPNSMGGYYVEGHYSFFPDFLRSTFLGNGLGFTDPRFTAFARWGQVDTDFANLTDADRNEIVLGMNYRPVPNTALKAEWQRQLRWAGGAPIDAFISSLAMGF
jgi:hypothetical protein